MENPIHIQDSSGDKKYFTIIPNFILNHSNASDQALYLQMKRIAGDGGICEAGHRYFLEQLGIGFTVYKRSLNYLIDSKWITFTGKKKVITYSGLQEVDTYRINDLWQINNNFYEGASKQNRLKEQGASETTLPSSLEVLPKLAQGASRQKRKKNRKEELKEETNNLIKLDELRTALKEKSIIR